MRPCQTLRILPALLILFLFNSCLKDNCTKTYTYFTPVYKTSNEVRLNIKSAQPKALERTGKIFVKGNYIFLNEPDKGIHVIDNSNPSNPKNISFIAIPGNMDMAVKGNTLYADLFIDLVTLDISDPLNVKVKKIIDNAFPHRYYSGGFAPPANDQIITDWIQRDTTVSVDCNTADSWNCRGCGVFFSLADGLQAGRSSSPFGMGGSMARFTIINTSLYTVSTTGLKVFSIAAPENPSYVTAVDLAAGIETIYPFKNKLFIGSNSGMFIYDVQNPSKPEKQGQFSHVRSCDPVIADDNFAYVTLRSGTTCQGFTNQMDVVNVTDVFNPSLVKSYAMTNPHGLSKDGKTIFVCDGKEGLRIFNGENVNNIIQTQQIKGPETFDVIAFNNVAIVSAADGLYQYDYSDLANVRLLSKIIFEK